MTVYVDPARWPFGRMIMCHMWADTADELFAMADKIGVNLKWFQAPVKQGWLWMHFDVCQEKRALAIGFGAVETDSYGPLRWRALQMIKSNDPEMVRHGLRKYALCNDGVGYDTRLQRP